MTTAQQLPLCLLREFGGQDVVGWHASEKICGLRIQWDGTHYRTRSGAVLDVPASYHTGMKSTPLDGEMATLDGDLNRMLSLQKLGARGDWSGVYFRPFDLPLIGVPVEDRLATLADLELPPQCLRVPHLRVLSMDWLNDHLQSLMDVGAEGCVFREPASTYHDGRHSSWMKLVF